MTWEVREGDCLEVLRGMDPGTVQTCVTSPPYWGLRDYGAEGQLGLEPTPEEYVSNMVAVFREVKRVLRDDGTLWLNLGDSYAGPPVGSFNGGSDLFKGRNMEGISQSGGLDKAKASGLPTKSLIGLPWKVALALQSDDWLLRSEIIWAKTACMPERAQDRPGRAHEHLFLLTKGPRYIYHREPDTPNLRTVWTVAPAPFPGAHFATFPPKLIEPCVKAGSAEGDVVLDPFNGAGTTGVVATRLDRSYIGIELNPDYAAMSRNRIRDDAPLLNAGLEAA